MSATSHLAGDLVAAVALVAACGWVAGRLSHAAHTPAPVRRAAATTARTIRHPIKEGKKGAPKAAESVEAIWAKVKAQDWLERRQAKRKAKDARPPRAPRRFLPRLAINVPGVTSPAPGPAKPAPTPTTTGPAPSSPAPAPAPGSTPPANTTPAPAPAPAGPASTPAPTGRPRPMPRNVPADFASVIARIHNTEHESDAELMAFIRGLAAGFQGIAEALEDHTDHLLNGIGLDPAAVKCWHDISSSAADCSSSVTKAESAYLSTYKGATETASNGTLMPFKGRFISGEVS